MGILYTSNGVMPLMEPKISHQIHLVSNPFFVISHLTKRVSWSIYQSFGFLEKGAKAIKSCLEG